MCAVPGTAEAVSIVPAAGELELVDAGHEIYGAVVRIAQWM